MALDEGGAGGTSAPGAIVPGAIPQFEGNLDAVDAAGIAFRSAGRSCATAGTRVDTTFQGLSGCYHAPEAWQLLSSTAPVRSAAGAFGSDLASVGIALSRYAAEMRPVAARLDTLWCEASAFTAGLAGSGKGKGLDWRSDQDAVATNDALVGKVDAAVLEMQTIERRCANTIDALYGGTQWHAVAPEHARHPGPGGYGLTRIPSGWEPWGSAVEVDRPWWSALGHAVLDLVDRTWWTASSPERMVAAGARFRQGEWDAVVGMKDGVWLLSGCGVTVAMAKEHLGLTPERSWREELRLNGQAWAGLGLTAAAAGIYGNPVLTPVVGGLEASGHAPRWLRTVKAAGANAAKGFVAWDMWQRDPARAAGSVTVNVATLFLPGPGEVAGAVKGAVLGVRGGEIGAEAAARAGAHAADVTADGASATARGAVRATRPLGDPGDLGGTGARGAFDGASDGASAVRPLRVGDVVARLDGADAPLDVRVPGHDLPDPARTPHDGAVAARDGADGTRRLPLDDHDAGRTGREPAVRGAGERNGADLRTLDDTRAAPEPARVGGGHDPHPGGHDPAPTHPDPRHEPGDGERDGRDGGRGGGGNSEDAPPFPEGNGRNPHGGVVPEGWDGPLGDQPDGSWVGEQYNTTLDLKPHAHDRVIAFGDHAAASEPRLAHEMAGVADHADGHLAGLQHDLKAAESLKRKVAWELDVDPEATPESVLADTHDAVRFTLTSSTKTYAHTVERGLADLQARGFTWLERPDPVGAWKDRNTYQGLNTVWRDPVGGQTFEVQFHTPESLRAKEETHPLYREQRITLDIKRKLELMELQAQYFRNVPVPDGLDRIRLDGKGDG